VRFSEVLNRITGITCPVFGVNWQPPEADRTVARRVVTFLEDRRVLYTPSEMEVPEHCVSSVLQMREHLTRELQGLTTEKELADHLRAMRAACRKFLNVACGGSEEVVRFGGHRGHWASWTFNSAVGELRGTFGHHVAALAAQYGLDVEDDLASILPASDVE
jgi:hypothetical protein